VPRSATEPSVQEARRIAASQAEAHSAGCVPVWRVGSEPAASDLTPGSLSLDLLGMRGQALKGHLDLLLLAVLSDGARHGYAAIEDLREKSDDPFDLPEGTVYPPSYG